MASIGLKVSGNVISELSDKIPSHIVALNELIKNAYDAFATEVRINLDISNKRIIIIDDGVGMDNSGIKKLFHIAKSEKKYGTLIKNKDRGLERYTQGSKGLGFLSVFKFGSKVKWVTNKDNKRITFSVNKDDLIKLNNVASYQLKTEEELSTEIGTTIYIELDHFYVEFLENYFSDDKNLKKITNAFCDEKFKIILETAHGIYEGENISTFINIAKEDQLFYITYSSKKKNIEFFYNGELVKEEIYDFNTNKYELDIELIAYSFASHGKRKISSLYYREHDNALTPLIYINDNLFHNYTLFDVNIVRQKKSSETLPQLIGYIKIKSCDSLLEFNSDRTQFVQNKLTHSIETKLRELNEIIQKIGSEIKKALKNENGKLKTGPAYPINHKSCDDKENNNYFKSAQITFKEYIKRIYIPSNQIDLLQEIKFAVNSEGEKINLNQDIQIAINGKIVDNHILESQAHPCEKKVTYSYNDKITGKLIKTLILKFEIPKAKIIAKGKNSLFNFPSIKEYKIEIPYVWSLITQLENLNDQKEDYNEVIGCALRSIFEICCDFIKNRKTRIFPDESNLPKLEGIVKYIISFIKLNHCVKTEIVKITGINFNSLNNLLIVESFDNAIKKAHLGAHKSMSFLTDSDVKDIAKMAGLFAIFSNILLYQISDDILEQCEKPTV